MNALELIVFIITRGRGDMLIDLCSEEKISFSLIIHGRGTASSEVLSMLGLGSPEKDVVLISVEADRADELMARLADRMKLKKAGGGIAFSIPFAAVASQFMSYELLAGTYSEETEESGFKKLLNGLLGKDGGTKA